MEALMQDLKFGIRTLLRNPGFTLVAITALALGIGGNTAIFSVVNSILLRPLPYPEPDRIMQIWASAPTQGLPQTDLSVPRFDAIAEQNNVFERVGAYAADSANLTGLNEPVQLRVVRISSGVLDVLKVRPAIGRNFLPEEDKRGGPFVVILSHALWTRDFGSDQNITGKAINLDGQKYTVVGVMPAGFNFFGNQSDVLIPRVFEPSFLAKENVDRGAGFLYVIGRLKPGATLQQANSDLTDIVRRDKITGIGSDFGALAVPLPEQETNGIRPTLFVLLGAVAFVLLIACANVANLLLAKAVGRQKEITVRAALGASRWRLIRQFLTESVLLAIVASSLGVLIASWGISPLTSIAGGSLPRVAEIGVDGKVLVFTILISIVTGLIFGLAPALQASRLDLNESLKDNGRGSTGSLHRNRLRSVLVVAEVALSVILLIGAGLLIRSFVSLLSVDPGFNPNNVLVADISLPATKYAQAAERMSFYHRLEQQIEALPGVQSVASVQVLPLSGGDARTPVAIQGRPVPPPNEIPIVFVNTVTPNYFKTMNIPLIQGRMFNDHDNDAAPPTIIINQSFKNRFFPNEDPIGKHIVSFSGAQPPEIVGVVANVREIGLDTSSMEGFYFCANRRPQLAMSVVVRTAGPPLSFSNAVRDAVIALDKNQPVASFQTMESVASASIARRKFMLILIGIFAAIALVLATIGIYSVMAYTVSQRTGEIGLRMALGARPVDVLKQVMGQGLRLVLIGLGVGLVTAFALTRVMQSLLFSISATDPVTFVVVPVLLTCVALLACFIPARRATRIDPLVAMRYE